MLAAGALVTASLVLASVSSESHARGGFGGGFSRGGAASFGGFSGGLQRGDMPQGGFDREGSISANEGQRQDAFSSMTQTNQEGRRSAMTDNQAQRQQTYSDTVDTRQQGATQRQQEYYNNGNYYRPPAPGYYPPPNNYYYANHDDDDWDSGSAAVGMVAGAALGAAAASARTENQTTTNNTVVYTQPSGGLPCAAQTETVNSVIYYRCGQQYYMQAYGSHGPVYMPVAPPG